jgi:hypothetical protein
VATETEASPEALPAKVDERVLMDIATNLPRYDRVDDIEAVGIFAELLEALQAYLRALQLNTVNRSTVTTMRQSLSRLDQALQELSTSLQAADPRGQQRLYELMGTDPFQDAEVKPLAGAAAFPNAWDRGAYRMAKLRDYLGRLGGAVATSSAELENAPQQRRGPDFPGLDGLVVRLAELYTRFTGRPFSMSQNRDSGMDFVTKVIETLPKECRPTGGSLIWAVRRAVERHDK